MADKSPNVDLPWGDFTAARRAGLWAAALMCSLRARARARLCNVWCCNVEELEARNKRRTVSSSCQLTNILWMYHRWGAVFQRKLLVFFLERAPELSGAYGRTKPVLYCKSTGTCLAPTRVCKQPNGQETVLKENCWISFPCSSRSVRRSHCVK